MNTPSRVSRSTVSRTGPGAARSPGTRSGMSRPTIARTRSAAVSPARPLVSTCRLSQLGAQVPGDVAIVGYDDIDFAGDSAVPLTSVRQPKYQLGQAGAELLLEEADHPAQHEHRRIVFTPELITRASSQPETAPAAPLPGEPPA